MFARDAADSADPVMRATQGQVLQFVSDFTAWQGLSPTVPEIAAAVNCGQSVVEYHLQRLLASGALVRVAEGARGIRPPLPGRPSRSQGQSLTEFALIILFVVIVVVGALALIGPWVVNLLHPVAPALSR